MIVLDASAAVNMAQRTPEGDALTSLIDPGEEVWSPQLLQSEVLSAFWKYVHAGMMSPETAEDNVSTALRLVTHFVNMIDLLPGVLSTAIRLDHSPYDVQYLVLAKLTGGMVYSLDDKLLALCDAEGVQHVERIDL